MVVNRITTMGARAGGGAGKGYNPSMPSGRARGNGRLSSSDIAGLRAVFGNVTSAKTLGAMQGPFGKTVYGVQLTNSAGKSMTTWTNTPKQAANMAAQFNSPRFKMYRPNKPQKGALF